ncbi:MAG: hypothetical protein ACREB3_13225, partial [Burkholderiales bacterium]
MRFHLIGMYRAFGSRRLEMGGDAVRVRDAHLRHFEAEVVAARAGLTGFDQAALVERLMADHDNLRAAMEWAVQG